MGPGGAGLCLTTSIQPSANLSSAKRCSISMLPPALCVGSGCCASSLVCGLVVSCPPHEPRTLGPLGGCGRLPPRLVGRHRGLAVGGQAGGQHHLLLAAIRRCAGLPPGPAAQQRLITRLLLANTTTTTKQQPGSAPVCSKRREALLSTSVERSGGRWADCCHLEDDGVGGRQAGQWRQELGGRHARVRRLVLATLHQATAATAPPRSMRRAGEQQQQEEGALLQNTGGCRALTGLYVP